MLMGVIVDVVGERDERSRANNAVASACVDCGAGGVRLLDAGINLQNVTTAISFLTQRTAEQLENITIMCDGQQVHECTDSEQMVALLQSGRAVFGVSVGSLWKQIRETLAHEEYVDLTTMPSMMGGNRPVDDITAMRMRKNFEAQHQTRAAASL